MRFERCARRRPVARSHPREHPTCARFRGGSLKMNVSAEYGLAPQGLETPQREKRVKTRRVGTMCQCVRSYTWGGTVVCAWHDAGTCSAAQSNFIVFVGRHEVAMPGPQTGLHRADKHTITGSRSVSRTGKHQISRNFNHCTLAGRRQRRCPSPGLALPSPRRKSRLDTRARSWWRHRQCAPPPPPPTFQA